MLKSVTFRITLCMLAFMLHSTSSIAQSIDSIQQALENHPSEDQKRVGLLYDLAGQEYLVNANHDIALNHLNEAEQISNKINYTKGKADSHYLKGIIYRALGDFDKADNKLHTALSIYKDINDEDKQSQCNHHIAILYYHIGEYQKSVEYYTAYSKYREQIGDSVAVTHAMNNIGNSYADMGDFEMALEYYNRALKGHIRLDNKDGIATSYNCIGTVYLSQTNNPKAYEYFNKSLYIRKSIGDSIGMVYNLNNLGIIHKRQEEYDKAIQNYEEALSLLSIKKHKDEIAQLKSNMGMAYCYQKDYNKALSLLQESIDISESINRTSRIAISLNNMGDIHYRKKEFSKAREYYQKSVQITLPKSTKYRLINSYIGISSSYLAESNYDSSFVYILKAKVIADELDLLGHKSDVEEILYEVYKAKGNHTKALESLELFKLYEDSLQNSENTKKITALEYEYKYKQELESAEEREQTLNKKVDSANKDLEKSKKDSLIAVIVILIISLISVIVIFILKLRHARAKNQNILIEQKLLRSQMTPHFIFNSLSVLQGMILNKEEDKSIKYLSEFSKLLRTILENSRHKSVALSRELIAVDSYMKLLNLDANPPYIFKSTVDEGVDIENIMIPPMLIQPFVENAIEHAFPLQSENRIISIAISMQNSRLICIIEDNGVGINTDAPEKSSKKSLATTITSERLDILSKEFKCKGSISIKNKADMGDTGTIVKMEIPFKFETAL